MDYTRQLEAMTLRQKIGQLYLQYFKGYQELPSSLKKMNREGELGGIIFFSGNNVKSIEGLHDLCVSIQELVEENPLHIPYLLTIDQEGGQLTAVFNGTTIFPGNMTLGQANDTQAAYEQGVYVAKEMKYAGINLCYAPVLDVDYDARYGMAIVDNRRYSTDPRVVATMGSSYIEGSQSEGIMACGKHFPGMRMTEVDTHFQVDRHPGNRERLMSVEVKPFKEAIDKGLSCIMTHHGVFEGLDPILPASLSPVIHHFLRYELAFDGLVVTDDLVMKAVRDEFGEREAIRLAINAGADLIITTCATDWFVDYVEQCVKDGKIKESRIDEACCRVLRHKSSMHVVSRHTPKTYNQIEGQKLATKIAIEGLTCVKWEPRTSMHAFIEGKIGVIHGNPARLVMSDATNLYDINWTDIIHNIRDDQEIKESIMPWAPTKEEVISLVDIGIISDIILFTTVNAYRFEKQLDVLRELRLYNPNKTIIALASRSPMDGPLLAGVADIVLISGGMTRATYEAVIHYLTERSSNGS